MILLTPDSPVMLGSGKVSVAVFCLPFVTLTQISGFISSLQGHLHTHLLYPSFFRWKTGSPSVSLAHLKPLIQEWNACLLGTGPGKQMVNASPAAPGELADPQEGPSPWVWHGTPSMTLCQRDWARIDSSSQPVLGITTTIMVIASERDWALRWCRWDALDYWCEEECPSPSLRVGHIALGLLLT